MRHPVKGQKSIPLSVRDLDKSMAIQEQVSPVQHFFQIFVAWGYMRRLSGGPKASNIPARILHPHSSFSHPTCPFLLCWHKQLWRCDQGLNLIWIRHGQKKLDLVRKKLVLTWIKLLIFLDGNIRILKKMDMWSGGWTGQVDSPDHNVQATMLWQAPRTTYLLQS